MAGINVRSSGDNRPYQAVGATNIKGGNLVIPSATATSDPTLQGIAPAGAGALNCLGVAGDDAITLQNRAALETGTGGDGYPFVDVAIPDATVTVYNHKEVLVVYAANANHGDRLKCAANGQVTPFVNGTDTNPALIVGWCSEVGGVTSGAVGYIRLTI